MKTVLQNIKYSNIQVLITLNFNTLVYYLMEFTIYNVLPTIFTGNKTYKPYIYLNVFTFF